MLDHKGFDLWADNYDKSVGLSDEDNTYPFAGYKAVLNAIYGRVLCAGAEKVLDIGFGTGTLTAKLYAADCQIYGQDFSDRMLALAQEKMPKAQLLCGDFSAGLAKLLTEQRYDAIIATYSLHHLTDAQKVTFLRELLPLLREGGCLYIGDVAFENRAALCACREEAGELWDDEEIYCVYDELRAHFPALRFEAFSPCAGLLTLQK